MAYIHIKAIDSLEDQDIIYLANNKMLVIEADKIILYDISDTLIGMKEIKEIKL